MVRRTLAALFALAALWLILLTATGARADIDKPPVVIWPTLTPAGDGAGDAPLHRPLPSETRVYERAQELDATLRDAVQDLGFTLYVADAGPAVGHTRDEDLIARAARSAIGQPAQEPGGGTWVVSPRIESAGGTDYVVRIVAVPPASHELRVRVETVSADHVAVRGLVMLRALLTSQAVADAAAEAARANAEKGTTQGVTTAPHSQGRAVLAISGGAFGAFTAFSLEQAGGSTDPRVLYPLLAVGTGIGIGAALLAADEWDVTTGDAWYLSAGGLWGAAGGMLIAAGRNVEPTTDRYSWGVGGGLIGISLATFALTRAPADDGDATLTHSGAVLGLALGAAIQFIDTGSTSSGTPYSGMGYGASIGVIGAGLLATQVTLSPSRMVLIDVGTAGGALIGAAAGSPLVFQNQTPANTRGWLAVTLSGAVVGGGLAWWLTRDAPAPDRRAWRWGTPNAGIIGATPTRTGSTPAYGVSWTAPLPF
jgi:hypothetical protein